MYAFSTKQQDSKTVALPGGGTLVLRPVTTPVFEAAKATARKKLAELLADTEGLKALGLDAQTDLLSGAQEGLYLGKLIEELGVRLITDWTGIADETGEKAAEVTPENIRRLLQHPWPAKALYEVVIAAQMPDLSKKKGSGTAAGGSSAAAPATAKAAGRSKRPARKG